MATDALPEGWREYFSKRLASASLRKKCTPQASDRSRSRPDTRLPYNSPCHDPRRPPSPRQSPPVALPRRGARRHDRGLTGKCTDAQIAALLVALHMKGETVEEIVGFAEAIRAAPLHCRSSTAQPMRSTSAARAATRWPERESLVDTCGTGGDASGTFNISTATAFVAPEPACAWPSTATAASARNAARPTSWRPWA